MNAFQQNASDDKKFLDFIALQMNDSTLGVVHRTLELAEPFIRASFVQLRIINYILVA